MEEKHGAKTTQKEGMQAKSSISLLRDGTEESTARDTHVQRNASTTRLWMPSAPVPLGWPDSGFLNPI